MYSSYGLPVIAWQKAFFSALELETRRTVLDRVTVDGIGQRGCVRQHDRTGRFASISPSFTNTKLPKPGVSLRFCCSLDNCNCFFFASEKA